jgi:DNA-binding CsgD family transcriptional regulator
MDSLSRTALDFFNQAGRETRLKGLIGAFAPLARAAGYGSAACHHIARAGHPVAPRLMFSWALADADQQKLERLLSLKDAGATGLFLSAAPIALSRLGDGRSSKSMLTSLRGLVVPIHGPLGEITCVTLLGGCDELPDPQAHRTLQTAATLLASLGVPLAEVEADASPASQPSRREALCAHHVLEGLNDWEIGQELGLSEGAVALHIDRLKAKLQVTRRSEIPDRDWLDIAQQDDY